ncbi:MAG TPA: APC family permease [Bryobacteraceae bacterium]|nr:APC family permease [Bryobacteraceae bacterium]
MDFKTAEREVQRHSAELKKELRLGDLVLTQILFITGLFWFGTAGKLGSAHIMFWIPAVLLFYIPSGIVVVHLNREMPLEGGIYQWAKLRFGDSAGFLVAWNIWASTVLSLSMMASQLADNLALASGPPGAWIAESKWVTLTAGAVVTGGLMLVALRGLALGRWIHNAGGLTLIVILAAMALFALPRWFHGEVAIAPVAFSLPAVSLLNLNILGKMSFGAFFGFDGAAIFSGECRDPHVARSMRRSIWLAGPVIALIYVLGTSFVLVFTRPNKIDLISPAAQALTRGAQGMGIAAFIAPVAGVLLISQLLGYSSLSYNAVIRLPMVAGWDHLLPSWLSRLHPRYKTPVGSIVFIGVVAFVFTILGNLGVGAQEAFQLLGNGSFICYALAYLVMFAIPLVARGEKPPGGVRLAAASGFAMTLLYTVLSIFPIVDVQNAASFTMKVSGVVIAINVAGALYFWHAKKQRRALTSI